MKSRMYLTIQALRLAARDPDPSVRQDAVLALREMKGCLRNNVDLIAIEEARLDGIGRPAACSRSLAGVA
jgi:hypothetical protein